MYQITPIRLPPDLLARLIDLTSGFNLHTGHRSSMTPPGPTRTAYHPLLAALLPGTWTKTHLVSLEPGAQISGHVDAAADQQGTRYHLPLLTNPGCWCYHAGVWSQLEPGQVYTMDSTQMHGAVNWGAALRVHLLVDVEAG